MKKLPFGKLAMLSGAYQFSTTLKIVDVVSYPPKNDFPLYIPKRNEGK